MHRSDRLSSAINDIAHSAMTSLKNSRNLNNTKSSIKKDSNFTNLKKNTSINNDDDEDHDFRFDSDKYKYRPIGEGKKQL
jgi:hypothetical protein